MIEVSIQNGGRPQKVLEKMIGQARDATPVWRSLNREVQNMWRRAFDTSGRSIGAKWAPLKPASARARKRKPGANKDTKKVLWAYGHLRRSLVQTSTDSIVVILPHEFRRGTVDRKAAIHHGGSRKTNLPARPLYTTAMVERLATMAAEMMALHLTEEARGADA